MRVRPLAAVAIMAAAFAVFGDEPSFKLPPFPKISLGAALEKHHVYGKAPDDEISRRAWTNLIDKCDSERKYLLPSDIKALEPEADKLDDMLVAEDYSFASRVRAVYLKRLEETAKTSTNALVKARLESERRRSKDRARADFLSAIASAYDAHSDYLGPDMLKLLAAQMTLQMCGIGVALEFKGEFAMVREVVPGSPLAKDGRLRAGDRIVAISPKDDGDFVPVAGMDEVDFLLLVQGKKGEPIAMEVEHPGAGTERISVKRDDIALDDQAASSRVEEVRGKDGSVTKLGILRLPAFYITAPSTGAVSRTSHDDVRAELAKLSEAGVSGVLLDLRTNGGGSLDDAVRILGFFIRQGPAVRMVVRSGETVLNVIEGDVACETPVVVLIDKVSASASELVSATLQDSGRAVVVGDVHTFGKGSAQSVVPLGEEGEGALLATIGRFYRITGGSTQLKGVAADVVVESDIPTDVSEEALNYPLPWNAIAPVPFTPAWDLGKFVPELRKASAERMAGKPGKHDSKTVLNEALNVLADLVRLNGGRKLPQSASSAKSDDTGLFDDLDDE